MSTNAKSAVYNVIPFKQVGPLEFGMSRTEVLAVLGEFDREEKTYIGSIEEIRKNISTKYKNDKLIEVSFLPGVKLEFEGYFLLKQKGIDYLLTNFQHSSDLGFTVFPTLGLAFTGFGKSKDAKTVSVFNKATLKIYLKAMSNTK